MQVNLHKEAKRKHSKKLSTSESKYLTVLASKSSELSTSTTNQVPD